MKTYSLYSCSILIILLSLPTLSFAEDGYGTGENIPYGARAVHLLTNEARTDTVEALANCGSYCKEVEACRSNYDSASGHCQDNTSCIYPVMPPLWWDNNLYRAAQLHSNMLGYLGGCLHHPSPCDLKSSIGSDFPDTCDGNPSCACESGTATCNHSGTGTFDRIEMFITGNYYTGAENIAYKTKTSYEYKTGPYDIFHDWLFEPGDVTTCDSTNNNGHRMNIISTFNQSRMNYMLNAMGVGYGIRKTSSIYYLHSSQDFVQYYPARYSHQLTSGSHYYSDNSTLHFKTHYYSTSTPVSSVKLSLNGECIDLAKTRGSNLNGIYGTTSVAAPAKCTPYFFEAKDSLGNIIRFPESGSLLFTIDTTAMNCDNKSWQSAAATSCFSEGVICTATQHLNQAGTACEEDSVTACGTYDNDCTKIPGWGTGECNNKNCVATGCGTGYHPNGAVCEADDLDNCGSHGYKCSTKVTGWNAGQCTNGNCVATSCKSSYHIYESTCEADSKTKCGSHENDCTKATGWGDGNCENQTCVATSCKNNFHVYNQACEADSLEHCGQHDFKCADEITAWSAGNCTNGGCVASACQGGYHPNAGICESDSVSSCGSAHIDCSTAVEGWQSGSCENDTCVVTSCINNFHVYNQACEADNLDNCGQHNFKCADETTGWSSGTCTNGGCVASACQDGYHVNSGVCESNSANSCGTAQIDCSSAVEGWQSGSCENDTCVVTSCINDFHVYNQACEADNLEHCGQHDFKCADEITAWTAGTCTNGECVASACQDGYHVNSGICESDSVRSCGTDKIDCSTAVEGWQSGSCENDTCVPIKCISGYHAYEQICETDSLEHCGAHDINCANTIADWKSGECQAGECIVTACNGNKVVSNHACVDENSGDGTDHSGEGTDHSGDNPSQQAEITDYIAAPVSNDCSGIPQSKSHSSIWWMLLGLAGLGLWRRKRMTR